MLQIILTALLLGTGYVITLAVYRLTLHPLAKIPGPKFAGLTFGYAFYYEVVQKGRFTFHIQDLHKQYGPIIRITPNEIHIDDPDFFEDLYAKQGRLDRDPRMSPFFGNAASIFSTTPSDLHKIRRAPLAPLFSRKRILELQPLLQSKVKKLQGKIAQYRDSGKPFGLGKAYMALAEDMIFEYCFGESYNKLDAPEFSDNLHEAFSQIVQTGYVAIYFPWVPKLLMSLPPDLLTRMEPIYASMFRVQKDIRKWALDIQEGRNDAHRNADHAAVLVELINSDMPAHEKVASRVGDEAQNLLGAGVSTTGWAATVTGFHIVNNNKIYQKLHHELEEAFPDPDIPLDWIKLEKLPYMQACIKEGLRISTGESIRSPRIANHAITYGKWQIPPNVSISMSIVDVCFNEKIFPDAHSFNPERWLDSSNNLDKYYVFFSKGYRTCLGMQLAYAELYHMIGGVFRNFELELFETDISDVEMAHDFFIPLPKLDSKGVRVKVKNNV